MLGARANLADVRGPCNPGQIDAPTDPWGTCPSTFRKVALAILEGSDDGDPCAIVRSLLDAGDLDGGDLTIIVTCLLPFLSRSVGCTAREALFALFDAVPDPD